MTEKNQIYMCKLCRNVIKVLHAGGGELICCGKPMNLIKAHTIEEEGNEKHKPVIEANEEGVTIKVGSVAHPMEAEHYIEWIGISTDKGSSKKFLKAGDAPEVVFPIKAPIETISARAYCNVHGLWTS